jgi:hypothetical protein
MPLGDMSGAGQALQMHAHCLFPALLRGTLRAGLRRVH